MGGSFRIGRARIALEFVVAVCCCEFVDGMWDSHLTQTILICVGICAFASLHRWEVNSIVIDSSKRIESTVDAALELCLQARANPMQPPRVVDTAVSEADRAATIASVTHQVRQRVQLFLDRHNSVNSHAWCSRLYFS